jgi:putative membrane protein
MIRYVRLIFLGLVGLSLLTVALANRTPVILVIFGGIVVGVLIGFVWEWFREHGHRATASQKAREVTRLERELAVLKDSTSVPPKDDVLALLEKH